MVSGASTEENSQLLPQMGATISRRSPNTAGNWGESQADPRGESSHPEEAKKPGQVPGRCPRWHNHSGPAVHGAQKAVHSSAHPAADSHEGTRSHTAVRSRRPCSVRQHWLGSVMVFPPPGCPPGSRGAGRSQAGAHTTSPTRCQPGQQ